MLAGRSEERKSHKPQVWSFSCRLRRAKDHRPQGGNPELAVSSGSWQHCFASVHLKKSHKPQVWSFSFRLRRAKDHRPQGGNPAVRVFTTTDVLVILLKTSLLRPLNSYFRGTNENTLKAPFNHILTTKIKSTK